MNSSWWNEWESRPATVAVPHLAGGTVAASPPTGVLLAELARRWQAGERPRVEELLARHPGVEDQEAVVLRLVQEEYALRMQHGEAVSAEELCRRFPRWHEKLEELLAVLPTRRDPGARPCGMPRAGETLGDFQLLAELGRGSEGVVFLARQTALADRPVILKVTPCHGQEHLALARLQHTHIVPLYAVQQEPRRNLRVLVMPYFGGTTLAHVLESLLPIPPEARTGKHILDAIDRGESRMAASAPAQGPWRQLLARVPYVQAVCWIGAAVAEALDYAHQHGLVHLDVKPSNILLARDCQPMLLDFHLARPAVCAGETQTGFVGGTLLFMPREQHEALAARNAARPATLDLDGRADLFSLAATLYSALGGRLPVLPGVSPSLHAVNPQVSPGLSEILARCLASAATDRYPDAASFADDLRRHLADRPLAGVVNRSLRERWRKWRRRRPQALVLAVMLLAVLGAACAVGVSAWGSVRAEKRQAGAALAEGQMLLSDDRPAQAAQAFRRGLELTEGLPLEKALRRQLAGLARQADDAEAARNQRVLGAQLHALVDQVRFQYGSDAQPSADVEQVAARCAELWQRREQILELLGKTESVERDLLDLALLHADLHVRLAAPSDAVAARRHALLVLNEAEPLLGSSPVLLRERQRHAAALGLTSVAARAAAEADRLPVRTAWEHFALGRLLLNAQKDLAAVPTWRLATPGVALVAGAGSLAADALLERAVALDPGGFWPNFVRGQSAYQLGRHEEAVRSFSVCIGAAPAQAPSLFNRALALAALGREEAALEDFEQARKREPALASRLPAVCYNLAVSCQARSDVAGARRHLDRGLRADPRHDPSQTLLRCLTAR